MKSELILLFQLEKKVVRFLAIIRASIAILSVTIWQLWWPIERKLSQIVILCIYVGIHQVRILVFDNHRRCSVPLKPNVLFSLYTRNGAAMSAMFGCSLSIFSPWVRHIQSPIIWHILYVIKFVDTHSREIVWLSKLCQPIIFSKCYIFEGFPGCFRTTRETGSWW